MRRLIYFTSGLLLVVGGIFLASRPESRPPPNRTPAVLDDPDADPLEVGATPEEPPAEAPEEGLPVAIVGRVVGPAFRPVAGARLALGEEATTTGQEGTFRFEPGVRPRTASLACEIDGRPPLTWEVVVGSTTADPQASSFESAPARLEWIRWTVSLMSPPDRTDSLWVHADSVLIEEWGSGGRVQVRGSTDLPDGAHVAASVYFDEMRSFSSFDAGEVQGGEFRVVLWGMGGHRLFSGRYGLKLTFNEIFELPSALEVWKRDRPEISTWSLTTEQDIFVGDEEQAAAEDRAAQAYYTEAREVVQVLKSMLVTRVREAQSLGRRWDPRLLKGRVEARAGWFHEETVTEDGRLAEVEWRAFLDDRWRPEVQQRLDDHLARGPQKYQEAEGRVQSLLDDLLRESYVYSRFVVYPIFGLPGHPNDFYQDEGEAGDLTLLELKFRKNLSGLERFCRLVEDTELRRVGVGE